jgi:hypothetical protein
MKLELMNANETDIELLGKVEITTAQHLLDCEPASLVIALAQVSLHHNTADRIPSKRIVEAWVSQAKGIEDKRANLFPGLGGKHGGGGPKII